MARTFSIGRSENISWRQRRLSYSGWAGARANLGVDWGFLLCATWAKDLGACLGTWGLVAIFAGVSLTVAVLAGGGGKGALDTTGAGVGTFWEGTERLVKEGTLSLPLLFLLVTVVKRASFTAG